jgi:hypothetical protein
LRGRRNLKRRSWRAGFNGEEGAASDGDAIIEILLKMATAEKSFVCGFVGSWGKVWFLMGGKSGVHQLRNGNNMPLRLLL